VEIQVEIYVNKMVLKAEGRTINLTPNEEFTTTRLLIGNFISAEECLKNGLKKINATGFFKRKPKLTIKPKEMVEGGLSQIEERVFQELAYGAGGGSVEINVC
jgi:rod shape-determining protein MreB and related proteins